MTFYSPNMLLLLQHQSLEIFDNFFNRFWWRTRERSRWWSCTRGTRQCSSRRSLMPWRRLAWLASRPAGVERSGSSVTGSTRLVHKANFGVIERKPWNCDYEGEKNRERISNLLLIVVSFRICFECHLMVVRMITYLVIHTNTCIIVYDSAMLHYFSSWLVIV